MDLYNLKKENLEPVDRDPFKLERDIQSLVENNMETLFDIEFVKSEFSLGEFRLDSLCFDHDSNSFVIVEYKKGSSYSVIDQGYSYLSLMLNNKSDFILEYNETKNKSLKRGDIDWSQSRIIFISPSFSHYQKNSVNFKDVPFELWEIKRFSNGTIGLDQHISSSEESIQKIDNRKDSVIKNVGKEVKIYDEKDHISKCSETMLGCWVELRQHLSEVDETELVPKKHYIGLKYGRKSSIYFWFKKESITIEINRGLIKPDGSKSKSYFNIDDPKNISVEKSWKWKTGTKGTTYQISFNKNSDIHYLIFLIKQKLKNLSNRK